MDNLIDFILHNSLLCIFIILLILMYIAFELYQAKGQNYYVSVQDAIQIYNHEKGIFLDVRDNKKYRKSHILGAISFSIDDLKSNAKFLKKYINTPVIVYSTDNIKAKSAYDILIKNGYSKSYVLKGGFKQWYLDKMPIDSKLVTSNY